MYWKYSLISLTSLKWNTHPYKKSLGRKPNSSMAGNNTERVVTAFLSKFTPPSSAATPAFFFTQRCVLPALSLMFLWTGSTLLLLVVMCFPSWCNNLHPHSADSTERTTYISIYIYIYMYVFTYSIYIDIRVVWCWQEQPIVSPLQHVVDSWAPRGVTVWHFYDI